MRSFTLKEIIEATGARVLSETATHFTGIGLDTRKDLSGQLFIALKGGNYDAHQFLQAAIDKGATGIMLEGHEEELAAYKDKITILKSPFTLKALQDLGQWCRRQVPVKVIGITGSNGKTTTKEFTAAVIGSVKRVQANKGNFNNHWGVPLTLLDLKPETEVAVVEMGMNHAGEITELVKIAEPDVVVCTTVGRAHIEYFGTIEKIAEAKEEIYAAASPQTVQVFNLDGEQTRLMFERARQRNPSVKFLTFSSQQADANVHLKIKSMSMSDLEVEGSIQGVSGQVKIPVFGAQNLTNLMAAASLGLSVGLSAEQAWKGLEQCRTTWGRNQMVHLKSGAQMIFDAYNANPDSMKALLDNVKLLKNPGKKIGVFGEMLEMGELAANLHRELGLWAGKAGFEKIYFIGAHARDFFEGLKQAQYVKACLIEKEFKEEMAQSLKQELQEGDIAVVKGSRGMKMERFVLPCEPTDFELYDPVKL